MRNKNAHHIQQKVLPQYAVVAYHVRRVLNRSNQEWRGARNMVEFSVTSSRRGSLEFRRERSRRIRRVNRDEVINNGYGSERLAGCERVTRYVAAFSGGGDAGSAC